VSFRSLDAHEILLTVDRLRRRIEERFPDVGLASVARDLHTLGMECAAEAASLGRPNIPLRFIASLLILATLVVTAAAFWELWPANTRFNDISAFAQGVEAMVQNFVFLGIAVWFLWSIERRLKRRIALRAMHQFRSLAHIVDMHQLTKDPEQLTSPQPDTESSPQRVMTSDHLGRYLDYCSEMLSLTSKLAALYVQDFPDPLVLQAVNEVESLTTGLSRKIWQKISVLEAVTAGR
jgi:hypothetical protein